MKLETALVLEGYFWRPGDTEKLSGRLRISEVGECRLEVLGVFGELAEALRLQNPPLPTIHGLIEGGDVTLYDCIYQNRNLGFGTVTRSTLRVGTVFRGAHLPPEGQARFTKLDAVVSGLDAWLQITGIATQWEFNESNKVKGAVIRYAPPPKIEIDLSGLRVGFEFAWTAPSAGASTEAKITHQAQLFVEPTTEMPFEDLRFQLGRLVNFLSFAIDQPLTVETLFAHTNAARIQTSKGDKSIPLSVFYAQAATSTATKFDRHDMLFAYPDVAEELGVMLAAWLEQHEAFAPAFNLFFAVRSGRHTYLESAFLSIAQAVETLHDRTSGETLEPPEVFATRVGAILEGCPEEFRPWLDEQLQYANKPSLRARLRRMLKPFASHFGTADARKDFVDKVADTRNFLTHYDPKLAERAAHGLDIYYLTCRLEALFQLHLLTMIGISPERIEHLLKTNEKLRWNLHPESP